jgi:hypothetical protein
MSPSVSAALTVAILLGSAAAASADPIIIALGCARVNGQGTDGGSSRDFDK